MNGRPLVASIVGIAPATTFGTAYRLAASDGGVFAFRNAAFYGSMGGIHLNAPIVGIAATGGGHGYWLVASDGGVFAFGLASFYGSMAGKHLNAPIVGMARTGDGKGYYLVASDGGVFAFGDASFYGSMAGKHLNAAVVGIASIPSGYFLAGSDGGVFAFGEAKFGGSGVGLINAPVINISATQVAVATANTVSGPGSEDWAPLIVTSTGDQLFLGASAKTTVSSFAVKPARITWLGGTVTLSAKVSNAKSCTYSVTPSIKGLPITRSCTNGTAIEKVTIPKNSVSGPQIYTFDLSVEETTKVRAPAIRLVVGPPNPAVSVTGPFPAVRLQEWIGEIAVLDDLKINWQGSSSIGALNDFAQQQVDMAASDLPYSSGQADTMPTSPYQYVPAVASGLSFMYNLKGNDGQRITNLVLDAKVIDKIFLGEITTWNDPSIAQINPQLQNDLPKTKIVPVFRTDASGENYLLSDYFLHEDGADFTAAQNAFHAGGVLGAGKPSADWPTPTPGVAFSESTYPGWAAENPVGKNGSDNAANYVSSLSSQGSITYVEPAYAKEHNFPVASLMNAKGDAVQPTSTNVTTALNAALLHADLTQDLTKVYVNPRANAYPLSSYSYCPRSLKSAFCNH